MAGLITTLSRWFGRERSRGATGGPFDPEQLLREAGYDPQQLVAAGPDWSHVDTREKAIALVEEGVLVELLLFPEEFGGPRVPENTVYVPPFAAVMKYRTDMNIIRPLIMKGVVTHYAAIPEYVGPCMVPIAIRLEATEPGQLVCDIGVWGGAQPRLG